MDISTDNETWKSISKGRYEVSSFGRIRRIYPWSNTFIGKILKPQRDSGGYLHVGLSVNGTVKTVLVHQLVAESFIGPRPEGLIINHKDGNKYNNYADNLEYLSYLDNSRHAVRLGLVAKGEQIAQSKLKAKEVITIKGMLSVGINSRIIAKMFSVTPQAIMLIKHRINWKWI